MHNTSSSLRVLAFLGLMVAALGFGPMVARGTAAVAAKPNKPKKEKPFAPGGKYRQGDMSRPRPQVIDPGTVSPPAQPGRPPSDAIVLFDGTDFSRWETRVKNQVKAPGWKIENGYMEVVPRTGSIYTKDEFGDCQLHLEWATPAVVKGNSQGRGNSGVFIFGFGEIQVLDSYQNDTYPDGQAAALYHRYPPLVNACRKPGQWQSYDIIVQTAKRDANGQVIRPALLTVLHNGIVVHHALELRQRHAKGRLLLQDHGNPVRYRNIWLRELKPYDSAGQAIQH